MNAFANAVVADDYLILEDLLVGRLKSEMPELKAVLTAMDLSGVQNTRLIAPAAHVIYLGDDIQSNPASSAAVASQEWMVVLVIKFAGTVTSGKGNREKAGPLIAKLLQTMIGWQPKAAVTPLRRVSAPRVAYENGFAYYPFTFKTTHVLLGKG